MHNPDTRTRTRERTARITAAPLPVGLGGRVDWRVENERGIITQRGACRNLITDAGLDLFGENGFTVTRYLHVGDDSTAPAVTDTALGNEIAVSGTLTPSFSAGDPGVYDIAVTWDSGIGGATGNLTEFGASVDDPGNLFSRALFRDEVGDPITISVSASEKLILTYHVELTVSPLVSSPGTGTVDISGVGAGLGVSYGWSRWQDVDVPKNVIHRILTGSVVDVGFTDVQGLPSYGSAQAIQWPRTLSPTAYSSGSHERQLSDLVYDTDEANATHYGYGIAENDTISGVHVTAFDNGDEFTKANTHQLTITPPKVSWGRTP